jgi:hypothetical protein
MAWVTVVGGVDGCDMVLGQRIRWDKVREWREV